MARTIVGMFEDVSIARNVVQDLVDHGFERDDISLIAQDPQGEYGRQIGTEGTSVAAGVGIGAAVGGLGGSWWV